jgi:hypothetical protein
MIFDALNVLPEFYRQYIETPVVCNCQLSQTTLKGNENW